ncbi:SapC family protein [Azohydromonas caseinilytica]|uniref:SapC family protein n=1 Tax=Azohydromonas caseinilytica TaxID=2728836 RepID=A0A848F6B8_9BURK|nr:SapC family protein [Azohydromonas caseinilytica]NML14932.1 SapC family protein [Azohydromonas caseinilytica]
MIHSALHRQPVALDRNHHRTLRLRLPVDLAAAAGTLNACFLHGAEFAQACLEYPIVFVRAGADAEGRSAVAPMAVLGLTRDENLYLRPDGGWAAQYLPAALRVYPFALAQVDAEQAALCIDRAYAGLSETEGEPLFEADGSPSELVQRMQQQLPELEAEVQRTRRGCERLMELDLLREMRLDISQDNGPTLRVDGFLAVDEEKLLALPDATLAELQRSGLLRLIHAHQLSMAHLRRLAERRAARAAAH